MPASIKMGKKEVVTTVDAPVGVIVELTPVQAVALRSLLAKTAYGEPLSSLYYELDNLFNKSFEVKITCAEGPTLGAVRIRNLPTPEEAQAALKG
jgi:hypothetical protein